MLDDVFFDEFDCQVFFPWFFFAMFWFFLLRLHFNHFFNFVSMKTLCEPHNLFFFIVAKRVRSARKNAYCISFRLPVFTIQFHWIFKWRQNDRKKFFRLEGFIPRNFHLWSKQRVFKEACRFSDSYFPLLDTHKKHFGVDVENARREKNCRNVKN